MGFSTTRPPVPLDVVRVAIEGTHDTFPWVNTHWLKVVSTGTPTGTQMNALAAAIQASYNARFQPGRSSLCQTLQTICTWNDGAGGQVIGAGGSPVAGGQGGAFTSMASSVVLSWRISVRYRGGKPRSYHCGFPTTAVADARSWTAGLVTAYTTDAGLFLADINALSPAPFTSVSLGVLREFAAGSSELPHGAARFLNPPIFNAFTSVVAKPGMGSQRRRFGANLN